MTLKPPAQVEITAVNPDADPMPVKLTETTEPIAVRQVEGGPSIPVHLDQRHLTVPQQEESDRSTLGQRRVNLIWERTQALMALSVVWVTLAVTAFVIVVPLLNDQVSGENTQTVAGVGLLFGLANLVVGFYFGRTNHQRSGGVGPNEIGR